MPCHPYALTLHMTTAEVDLASAAAELDRVIALLPDGVFLERASVDTMNRTDVLANSPLNDALRGAD